MKKPLLLFAWLCLCFNVRATTSKFLDSIKHVLHTTSDDVSKLSCLHTLSFEYGFINPHQGISYGRQCLTLATKIHNLTFQAGAYNSIANAYETLSDFDSAIFFYQKAYEIALKSGNPQNIALSMCNIGLCSKQLGNYEKALINYLAAYSRLKNEKI